MIEKAEEGKLSDSRGLKKKPRRVKMLETLSYEDQRRLQGDKVIIESKHFGEYLQGKDDLGFGDGAE